MKLKFFILPLLLALGLGPWALDLPAVIQNGVITFTPDGAVSHSLWRQNPGQPRPDYMATFTGSSYAVIGPVADGTTFYVKGNFEITNGQCCVETDFGFVVTPPVGTGTNTLRFIGPVNALRIQSATNGAGPWTDLALYSNSPVTLAAQPKQFIRTMRVVLPPPFP